VHLIVKGGKERPSRDASRDIFVPSSPKQIAQSTLAVGITQVAVYRRVAMDNGGHPGVLVHSVHSAADDGSL